MFNIKKLNKFPKDWEVVKLNNENYFEILNSGIKKFDGKKLYLSTKCIEKDRIINIEGEITFSNRPSRANMQPILNSVWFSKMKNTVKVYSFTEKNSGEIDKYILSTGFCGIKCKEKVFPDYLKQFFLSPLFNKLKDILVTGSTQQDIKQKDIENIQIILPPLSEQKTIAEILSTVDQAIQKVDEIIVKTEKLKRGLMQRLFTKGIGHKEFKDTEIGRIPKEWEVVKLEEIVEIFDHKRIPLSEQERIKRKGSYPYCGATGIIDWVNDYIFDGEYLLLAEDGGPFGKFDKKAYIMLGRFWVNNHAHVLKCIKGKTYNNFLLYLLNYLDLNSYTVGSTRKKLNQEHMKKIELPLPPLPEQQKIAEILSTVDKKLEHERKRKEKLERIKKGLMNDLLTGKRRVKL